MINAYSLSEHVDAIGKTIDEVTHSFRDKIKDTLKSVSEDLHEKLCVLVDDTLADNTEDVFKHAVAYEVRQIVTGLLNGDEKTIEKLNLTSEYTFDKLHEIRLKIWETCGGKIENSLIKELTNEIAVLKERLGYALSRNY